MNSRLIAIAGKNDVACLALRHLILDMHYPKDLIVAVPTRNDSGKNTWQESLVFCARKLGVKIVTLEELYPVRNLLFLSLEFDQIVRPSRFADAELYNFHFSKLPAYKGSGTSVLPILNGETESGVTLHRIDAGIDTGDIVAQRVFQIERDWTARDLYVKFLSAAVDLFKNQIIALIDRRVTFKPQPAIGASHFLVRDVNYSHTEIDFSKTAYQIQNHVRAYSFWEYQLATIRGRKVLSVKILGDRSFEKPGGEISVSKYISRFATIDYWIEVEFSPYDDFFKWARGEEDNDAIAYVHDIDRQDANGWSAAMMAAYGCKADRLRRLLDMGADPNQSNRRGTTVLMYAKSGGLKSGNFDCMKLILKAGGDPNVQDASGRTVFDYLQEENRQDVIDIIKGVCR